MKKPSKRRTPVTSTIQSTIEDAMSILQELRDEMQEVVDNTPENLQGSDLYSRREEAASTPATRNIQTLRRMQQRLESGKDLINPSQLSEIADEFERIHDLTVKARTALMSCQKMIAVAHPKFNWGASFLDSESIQLLNATPVEVDEALGFTYAEIQQETMEDD
jgi:hypothetical protein